LLIFFNSRFIIYFFCPDTANLRPIDRSMQQPTAVPPPRPKNPPPAEGPFSRQAASEPRSSFSSPSLSAVSHPSSARQDDNDGVGAKEEKKEGPRMRVARASYGAGSVLADVTDTLQRMADEAGGLTLDAFGYKGLRPNGCMNALFGTSALPASQGGGDVSRAPSLAP
jgi:hypothetical protein